MSQEEPRVPEVAAKAIDPYRSSQHWACLLLGTTRPTIMDWQTKGMPRNSDDTYDLLACRRWIDARREEERQPKASQLTITEHDQMAAEFRAKEAKRAYEERSGKLIPRVEAEQQQLALALAVRASLLSLPAPLAVQVENMVARDAERVIRQRMVGICEALRARMPPISEATVKAINEIVESHGREAPP